MPEEHNRVLTDHAADLLLAPTATAMGHLEDEGLAVRSVLVGDVMADVCLRVADAVRERPLDLAGHALTTGDYYLATVHRAENTDDPVRLARLVGALQSMDREVLLLVHPRLAARAAAQGLSLEAGSLRPLDPADYPTMVRLVMGAHRVLTDSGGLQKEAYLLGTPCVTLRRETEWVETVDVGWNVLCPNPVDLGKLASAQPTGVTRADLFGGGHAGERVIEELLQSSACVRRSSTD